MLPFWKKKALTHWKIKTTTVNYFCSTNRWHSCYCYLLFAVRWLIAALSYCAQHKTRTKIVPNAPKSCNLKDWKQDAEKAEQGPRGKERNQQNNVTATVKQLLSCWQTLEPSLKMKSSINSTTAANWKHTLFFEFETYVPHTCFSESLQGANSVQSWIKQLSCIKKHQASSSKADTFTCFFLPI